MVVVNPFLVRWLWFGQRHQEQALAENTANNRASVERGKLLLQFVDELVNAYLATVGPNPQVDVTYSRVELRVADLLDNLAADRAQFDIEDPARQFFIDHGPKVFEKLTDKERTAHG